MFFQVRRRALGPSMVVWLATTVASSSSASGQALEELKGVVGSEHVLPLLAGEGFAVFPVRLSGRDVAEVFDPAKYRVHMTAADTPGEELVFPAGEFIDRPPGRFRIWLQGEEMMSPFSSFMIFGAGPRRGARTLKPLPVIPAGRVKVGPRKTSGSRAQLRLLYAEGDPRAGFIRHELSRRALVGEDGAELLMPEGKVLAALWDENEKRYVALSRPFEVSGGETVVAPLDQPSSTRSHLVTYVSRPSGVPAKLRGLVVTADAKDPDVIVRTPWGIYSFWYDLAPGTVTLRGKNEKLYLEPAKVRLVGGRISRYEGTLSSALFTKE